MNVRVLAAAVFALGFVPALAGAQPSPAPSDPDESHVGAEWRLERERLAENCGELKKVPSCAATLVTGHPFHVSFGASPRRMVSVRDRRRSCTSPRRTGG
jgi:hypothetical protein